jgi:hypothetical protein
MEFTRDLLKTFENNSKKFADSLDQANKIYYSLLNLIIMLSSSSLLISVALVEKLFPSADKVKFVVPNILIVSWILLTISIIFGIIAELNAAIFHGNLAKEAEIVMKDLKKKISQGITAEKYTEDDNEDYIVSNTVLWGAVSINAYIFALLLMCFVLLQGIISLNLRIIAFIMISIFVIFVNLLLINGRNKISKRYK